LEESSEFARIFGLSYEVTNRFYEVAELILLISGSFLIPFAIGHPQFLVGALVNLFLILSAVHVRDYKIIFPILLPSIAALSRAVLFGPFTKYLLFMIPFIWIGNLVLVLSIKLLGISRNAGLILSGVAGSALKAAFLFSSAYLLFRLGMVPRMFLTSFGIMQFTTAAVGLIIAYPIVRLTSRMPGLKPGRRTHHGRR